MSSNYLYYHLVFTPKMRQGVIAPDKEKDLFAYILGLTENMGGRLIRINAAFNHIHILVQLPTTLAVAEYVRDLKRASSMFISSRRLFPKFLGWAREYFVETVSPQGVEAVKRYIMEQKEHHKVNSFEDEWLRFLPEVDRQKWDMGYFDQ